MKLAQRRGLVVAFVHSRAAIFGMALATVVTIAGCGEVGAPGSGLAVEDGALRGELAGYTADYPDGHSETHYTLRAPSGAEKALVFDREVDLTPGTEIKVWGTDSPEGLRVSSYRAVSPTPEESRRAALVNGSAYAPRSFAFVLVNLSSQGFKPAITEADVLGRMINNADSIRNYYLDDSYGRQDITTQVFGPIDYTLNGCSTSSNATGPGQLAADLRAMVPGTFQHYLWYFGTDQRAAGCSWQGLASLGTPDKPSKDTWYNASTNCVVLVQEPGHNFGMQHSSSLTCPGASFLDDPNGCAADEYGDSYDPMGNACRHMNAWQKTYQGWLGGCNGVSVTQSGVFTLLPFENRCDGAQFLKVKAPKVRTFNRPADGGGSATTETFGYYYVELRTPTDFDGMLGNRSSLTPQILIHVADDVRTRTQRGVHTFLLDMTPTTTGSKAFADAALPVGQTFTDPMGGVSITATAVSATQATITVTVQGGTGAPTCLDGTTFTAPGPGPESCGAGGGLTGAAGATGTGSGGASGGGKGGAGGRASAGGATGTGSGGGPASGTGGRAGSGGAMASSGSGGAVTAGSGGALGTGSGGSMGSGSGGSSGTGGTGGAIAGTGGSETRPGTGTGGNAPNEVPTVVAGCSCTTASGSTSWPWSGVSLGSGAFALLASARRRRRR
jgi:MYXO-CTERM domain-containing protein